MLSRAAAVKANPAQYTAQVDTSTGRLHEEDAVEENRRQKLRFCVWVFVAGSGLLGSGYQCFCEEKEENLIMNKPRLSVKRNYQRISG
ncbi:hypothetical protein RRG08_042382 [Elysia crispata]|uniref:Uncharacterized protein n=1 Tax=Elysia crispata TaxID=231223 RepID=A0AAE0ZDW3_9GAST|nr:hypothetical protein RRG08_042382 [Elysia crispata]